MKQTNLQSMCSVPPSEIPPEQNKSGKQREKQSPHPKPLKQPFSACLVKTNVLKTLKLDIPRGIEILGVPTSSSHPPAAAWMTVMVLRRRRFRCRAATQASTHGASRVILKQFVLLPSASARTYALPTRVHSEPCGNGFQQCGSG